MAAPLTSLATLPHGLPPWLVAFVERALMENQTLTENGASQAAQAREVLLQRLVAAASTTSMAQSRSRRPPSSSASTPRPSGAPSGRAPSPTAAPTPVATSGSAAATSRRLLPPRPRDMIPLPMPRTSPNGGGLDDRDPNLLDEVRR